MSTAAVESASPPPAEERLSDVLDTPEGGRVDWIERTWRFFVSVKLMVVLMALFAAGMAAGTFLNPKEDALVEIERVFAAKPWVIALYRAFELYAPFKSWWFTLILLLLALNNLASSIERLPRIFLIVRNPQRKLTDLVLRGLRNKREAPRGALDAAAIENEFVSRGYQVTKTEEGGVTYLFGERGSWTRFGVWAVHIALLIICAGAVYGRMFSFEGTMDLPEDGGMSTFIKMREPDGTVIPKPLVDRHGKPFAIRCDKFYLDRFKDGSARRYASDLVVLDAQGTTLEKKKIIVNDPLEYGGMKFYQATYQERPDQSRAQMRIVDTKTGEAQDVTVTPEKPFFLGDGTVRYSVVNYQPNFGELGPAVQVVREEGPPEAANDDAAGPAPKSTNFWVFANYPNFDQDFRGDRFGLQFKKLEPSYVTGIQVGYDPGVPWIYFGCFLMWAGLFVTFWTVHRRVWARVEDGKVVLAGAAHRNKDKFAREFEGLVEKLGLPSRANRA